MIDEEELKTLIQTYEGQAIPRALLISWLSTRVPARLVEDAIEECLSKGLLIEAG